MKSNAGASKYDGRGSFIIMDDLQIYENAKIIQQLAILNDVSISEILDLLTGSCFSEEEASRILSWINYVI